MMHKGTANIHREETLRSSVIPPYLDNRAQATIEGGTIS
jgi:hypothetical protein